MRKSESRHPGVNPDDMKRARLPGLEASGLDPVWASAGHAQCYFDSALGALLPAVPVGKQA